MRLEFFSPERIKGMSDETLAIMSRRCHEDIAEKQQYLKAINDEQQRRVSVNHPTLFEV